MIAATQRELELVIMKVTVYSEKTFHWRSFEEDSWYLIYDLGHDSGIRVKRDGRTVIVHDVYETLFHDFPTHEEAGEFAHKITGFATC